MDVGIRELKARLSHYVRAAHAGERVVITDRGQPVAVMIPPTGNPSEIPTALTLLVEQGRATPPTRVPLWPDLRPAKLSRSFTEVLDEDRDDK